MNTTPHSDTGEHRTLPPMTFKSRWLSPKETARLVREQVKAMFPGIRFSVAKEEYSGGASILVKWTDGPTQEAVETSCQRYQNSWFDGMDDSRHYVDHTLMAWPDGSVELVSFGVRYVNGSREISSAYQAVLEQAASALVLEQTGREFDLDAEYPTIFTDWSTFRPCNGHQLVWHLAKFIPAPVSKPATKRTRKL